MDQAMAVNLQIGQLIKDARNEKGISQAELASAFGYDTAQFISNLERGLAKPPMAIVGKLITYLGISERKIVNIMTDAYRNELTSKIASGKKFKKGKAS